MVQLQSSRALGIYDAQWRIDCTWVARLGFRVHDLFRSFWRPQLSERSRRHISPDFKAVNSELQPCVSQSFRSRASITMPFRFPVVTCSKDYTCIRLTWDNLRDIIVLRVVYPYWNYLHINNALTNKDPHNTFESVIAGNSSTLSINLRFLWISQDQSRWTPKV